MGRSLSTFYSDCLPSNVLYRVINSSNSKTDLTCRTCSKPVYHTIMAPQKGKKATKGAKQIVEENVATLVFFRNMGMGASAIYLLVTLVFFFDSFTTSIISLFILATAIHLVCFNLLRFASKATYGETGQLLDCGTDLNMDGGIAEHVKDMIILVSGSQLLSLTTNYFWLLLFLAPIRAVFMLWRSVLAPWFFQEGAPQPEMDEKKQKKMEKRRMQKN